MPPTVPTKCMALVVRRPGVSGWCPNEKHPDTPDDRPRCTAHRDGDNPKEQQ